MKKILLAGIAVTAFCGAPAVAADIPVKARPVPVVDPWDSCYFGLNTGYGWGHKDTNFLTDTGSPDFLAGGKTNVDGWAYGGQLGCDYHFVGTSWILGARVLWDGSDMKGSNLWPSIPTDGNQFKIKSFGTAVVKFGTLLNPTTELYGVAGLAWVHDSLAQAAIGASPFASGSWDRTGYDVGVGLTWMFTPGWDLFVEYDHMGFGTKIVSLQTPGGVIDTSSVKQSVDKILVGIDLRTR